MTPDDSERDFWEHWIWGALVELFWMGWEWLYYLLGVVALAALAGLLV